MHACDGQTQQVLTLANGGVVRLRLPAEATVVSGHGFRWGEASTPLTPAYWAAQAWMWGIDAPDHFRLGRTLAEEVLACMLGGYGLPAEVGLAAYDRLRAEMHACPAALADPRHVEALLRAPLTVNGRQVHYRFARQKAGYVSAAFSELPTIAEDDLGDRELRDRLVALRGVGPKTASWIVRNLRRSDEVAILDVHIVKAGRLLGIFDARHRVERHYDLLERAYLRFAKAIGARASLLDSVMWMTMRQIATVSIRRVPAVSRVRAAVPAASLPL